MLESKRQDLIDQITRNEQLRNLSRLQRLVRAPLRTIPYYTLALLGHIRPFKISFSPLWGGPKMTSYLPEGNTFYFYGNCEANLANFFVRAIRPGMTFFDVGAHIGFYSILGAALTESTGTIVSFEPTPWTYDLLIKNTKSYPNVVVENAAAGGATGETSFLDYGPGYGAYNTATTGAPALARTHTPTRVTVPVLSLSEYCAERSLHPDIIKIDAEGFELPILHGLNSLLDVKQAKRPLVTLEVANGDDWAESQRMCREFLVGKGYVSHEITLNGLLKREEGEKTYQYDNLIFVPNELLGASEIKRLIDQENK